MQALVPTVLTIDDASDSGWIHKNRLVGTGPVTDGQSAFFSLCLRPDLFCDILKTFIEGVCHPLMTKNTQLCGVLVLLGQASKHIHIIARNVILLPHLILLICCYLMLSLAGGNLQDNKPHAGTKSVVEEYSYHHFHHCGPWGT